MAWFPKKKVVVPVDFSDNSFGAVDTALELVENASGLHLLYVLPSHGRRGWDRLLLGSVAERVLRLATCPVLVLKV